MTDFEFPIRRAWAMPSPETFSIKPIKMFVLKHLKTNMVSVDPFARNCNLANFTNDLDPNTSAQSHKDAVEYMRSFKKESLDLCLFDPPYSPRQIAECYKNIGRKTSTKDTQNARLYKDVKDAIDYSLKDGGIVLSFGWNSGGMGVCRGYKILEILLVSHGGAHNDTICIAEVKNKKHQRDEALRRSAVKDFEATSASILADAAILRAEPAERKVEKLREALTYLLADHEYMVGVSNIATKRARAALDETESE